jgi:hypothetical protein
MTCRKTPKIMFTVLVEPDELKRLAMLFLLPCLTNKMM